MNANVETGSVSAWEETVVLPTYVPPPPDPNPMYLDRRVNQGTRGRVYPEHLGEGRHALRPTAHLDDYAGLTQRALCKEALARERFEQAAAPQGRLSAATYYQPLAMRELTGVRIPPNV